MDSRDGVHLSATHKQSLQTSPQPVPSTSSILDDTSESDSGIDLLNPGSILQSETSSPITYVTISSADSPDIEVSESSTISYSDVTYSDSTCEYPDWKTFCSTKWTPEMIKFYDEEQNEASSLDAILKSLPDNVKWRVDDEDRQGSSLQTKQDTRKKRRKGKQPRCSNCNQWGHVKQHCKEKLKKIICETCGMEGHKFSESQCPANKMCFGVCCKG